MADERIDIEITDKVSNGPRIKLQELADAARSAHSALEQLKASLAQINTNPVAKLTAAQAKLVSANSKLAESSAKVALSQQRLATEVQRTAGAQSRAELSAMRLKAAQDRMAKSAKDGEFSFSALKGQLLAVTATLGSLWVAVRLADDFANLENRLRSTGLEGDSLTEVMGKLKDSANNTRSSLVGTVELYSRLAVSSKELGTTQQELIDFTTSLNQAIILSGANAAEAQAGLIQLSQGMASGTLRGDELRSVLEQLPAVADVIAKSLGVTRGQLRQLGADGKITAQDILKAFKEAGPELGERFASQATTAGQALTVLHNNAMILAGEGGKGPLQQVVGLLTDMTKSLNDAKDEIGILAGTLEFLMRVVRTVYVTFSSVWLNMGSSLKGVAGNALIAFGTILSGAADLTRDLTSILPDSFTSGLSKNLDSVRNSAREFISDGKKLGEDIVAADKGLKDKIKEIWSEKILPEPPAIPDASGAGSATAETAGDGIKVKYEQIKRGAEDLVATYDREYAATLKLIDLRAKLAEAVSENQLTQERANEIQAFATSEILKEVDVLKSVNAELDKQFENLQLNARQLEINNKIQEVTDKLGLQKTDDTDIARLRERLELYQEQKVIVDELNKIHEATTGQLENIATAQLALGIAFAAGTISLEAYNLKLLETNAQAAQLRLVMGDGTWADVFNNALYSMVDNYEGVLPAMSAAFGDFFVSLEEGFANSIGRAIVYSEDLGTALQNVAKSAISDLISALIKMGIQTAVTSAMQTEATTIALATQTAESLAAASVVANAWAPAASMTSLASFGANAAPASAGLLATSGLAQSLANVPGYQIGGYTGNVGVSQVAGVVHGREYVFDAEATQRIGVGNLEALRNGSVGTATASGAGNTYINNYNYTDQVPNASQVERESNFTQFKRSMSSANADRTSKRAQVAL